MKAVLRCFARSDGNAAIEFALLATPFLVLLVAIFQTGYVCLGQVVLQTATTQASRLIMTGQAQTQGITASQFQQYVCNNATVLNCSDVYVNVQKFSSFSSMSQINPVQNGDFDNSALTYDTGSRGDIMLVQAFYQLPVITALFGFNVSNMSGGKRLIVGTAVFRNEPY